jgi:hypothetical protein
MDVTFFATRAAACSNVARRSTEASLGKLIFYSSKSAFQALFGLLCEQIRLWL